MKVLSRLVIIVLGFYISGCSSLNFNKMKTYYVSVPESTKTLDIPRYNEEHLFSGYPFVYWHFAKQKEAQLNLDSPELSNDSLIFRLWITNPIGKKDQLHGLLEIKRDFYGWSGNLYYMFVDFNAQKLSETITKYKKFELSPEKSDWTTIVDSLYSLKFDILPTDDAIPNYFTEGSGYYSGYSTTYSFEYATENQYRFYQYNYQNMQQKSNEFWQAENVSKILELLEDEFHWNSLGSEYFSE